MSAGRVCAPTRGLVRARARARSARPTAPHVFPGGACEGLIGSRRVDRGWMQPVRGCPVDPARACDYSVPRRDTLGPGRVVGGPRCLAARLRRESVRVMRKSCRAVPISVEIVDWEVSAAAPREDYGVIVTSDARDASFSEPRAASRGCRARPSSGKRL